MHRIALLFLCVCFCSASLQSHSQTISAAAIPAGFPVSGTVADTLNNTKLQYAAVVIIRAKDSTLATFARTDAAGKFVTAALPPGRYRLLITYPGFADYTDRLEVADKPVDIGTVPMSTSEHLLKEFVLSRKSAAIVIRGDTTEYNADSFRVQSGATVEDLLKKLPGLQVDKDGKITAQGEQVQKILVDGEEFFSDDPAVVTKSLQAAVLDKVQVYDKKSDAATFTGIDDGERTKTINLQLKENMKRGLFGKAVAAGGPSLSKENGVKGGFFENQAMVNLFRGKRQFSAFGIMSNTGTVGLSWRDADRYGSGMSGGTYDEETGVYFFEGADVDEGMFGQEYSGEGVPTVWTGGLHFADKFGAKDAQHVSANYRYSKKNVEIDGTTITQYILPDSGYVRTEHRSTFNTSMRHGGDGLYEWTIDTNSNVKLTVSGSTGEKTGAGVYATDTRGVSGTLINTSNRAATNSSSTQSLNADLSYRRKFHKAGRNMSIELRENYNRSDGSGYLNAGNVYYTDGLRTGADSLDQLKKNKGMTATLNGKFSYTEPLSKKFFLTARYGLTTAANTSERLSYNRAGTGDWSDTPDSLYSSSYAYDVFTQDGGIALRYVDKKLNVSLGANAFNTVWTQHDRLWGVPDRNRNYNNYAPNASLRYSFTKHTFINLAYSGSTQQPTLDQLQPLRQNTDPLNISLGNPDLHQEFRNNVRLNFHSSKPISSEYVYASASATVTKDDITRSDNFDALGRRTYQYVNVNGNYGLNFYGGYWSKFKSLDLSYGANIQASTNHATSFVNAVRNVSNNNSYTLEFSLDKDWKKGEKDFAGLNLRPGLSWHDNRATVSTYTQSYYTGTIQLSGYWEAFWKVTLRTDLDYDYRQKTEVFTGNNNVVRWNAKVYRKFLKGDAVEACIAIRDILDQNLGYTRNATDNYIFENRYNTIRRYLLFSLVWNIAKGPDAKLKSGDDE